MKLHRHRRMPYVIYALLDRNSFGVKKLDNILAISSWRLGRAASSRLDISLKDGDTARGFLTRHRRREPYCLRRGAKPRSRAKAHAATNSASSKPRTDVSAASSSYLRMAPTVAVITRSVDAQKQTN
jgi:hypothetical protein